jgi:hypothetical protein
LFALVKLNGFIFFRKFAADFADDADLKRIYFFSYPRYLR